MRFTKAELLAASQDALEKAHAMERAMIGPGGSRLGHTRRITLLPEISAWRHASRTIAAYAHGLRA